MYAWGFGPKREWVADQVLDAADIAVRQIGFD